MATATQSIREIVASQPSAAAILERFAIDLCANANKSLSQTCTTLQLSTEQVLEKLEQGERASAGADAADPASLSAARLIQLIVRTHHQFVRRELPRLSALSHKIAGKHGDSAPELIRVAALVSELESDMLAHLQKEELILFPYIAQLDQALSYLPEACFASVRQPIVMMTREHDSAQTILEEIRLLTQDFTPPAGACLSRTAFYGGLREFAADLQRHVHIEDNVLFPRAIAMEAESRVQR
jgi:regulator of cell morphogenesis and NO signaling